MGKINPDPISMTTHHIQMCFRPTDLVISSGTAFVYEHVGSRYLITAWHNLTGRNPLTGQCLSETAAVPDCISTLFWDPETPRRAKRHQLDLYDDDEMSRPRWLEHPIHGSKIDVVALPLPTEFVEKARTFPINHVDFDQTFPEEVGDDAFVVGYPFEDTPYLQLPVWKRASIATEPDVNIDGLPKFLVDTATRPGLSGSPVIMQRTGLHGFSESRGFTGTEIFGRIRSFSGVYSGRIGADENKLQLGTVWKAKVVLEIVEGRSDGTVPPRTESST